MTIQKEAEFSEFSPQADMEKDFRATEEEIIKHAMLRLNSNILGLVMGIMGALGIFVATNWLVIKGGEDVGAHLELLSQFFIGYTVTFTGSLIGAVYGFITGYLSGLIIGWIYNAVIFIKAR